MRIGIDCSAAFLKNRTGVGNYTFSLVDALMKIDRVNQYSLYPVFYNPFIGFVDARFKEVKNFSVPFKRSHQLLSFVLWTPAIPARMKEFMLGTVDLVHCNTFSIPHFKKAKLVSTMYDLTVITHPECHQKANIERCLKGIRASVERADHIIAISECTKRDLVNHLGAPEELITVTHLAAGPEYSEVRDKNALASVRAKYNLPENYVLFVGSLEPRKNIKTLLKAYSAVSARLRKAFPLVIAGAKGWLNSDIPSLVEGLGIKESVRFTGYIDANDICAVYSGASVFAYPSLYEGFGLPILEAMSCGAPVITSNTSSMPEVAGDAARLIDPLNAEELASALEAVLDNETLRAEMKKKGLARAASFSWDRCARETLGVYGKVAASPKRN